MWNGWRSTPDPQPTDIAAKTVATEQAKWSRDGSLDSLAVDCSGVVMERIGPNVILLRVDIPGEASRVIQVRAVGSGSPGLRAVFLELQ